MTLVDRGDPQRAATWGNAGHFAYEQIFPLAQPGIWPQLPRMLFSPDGPLWIPPASWFSLAPWLCRFAWNTRPSQVRRASAALACLLSQARAAWSRLAEAADLRSRIKTSPILVVARDMATMSAKRSLMKRYRREGIEVEELDCGAAREIEPALRADIAGAFSYPNSEYTTNPGELVAELAAAFVVAGGRVIYDEVCSVRPLANGDVSVMGANQNVEAMRHRGGGGVETDATFARHRGAIRGRARLSPDGSESRRPRPHHRRSTRIRHDTDGVRAASCGYGGARALRCAACLAPGEPVAAPRRRPVRAVRRTRRCSSLDGLSPISA